MPHVGDRLKLKTGNLVLEALEFIAQQWLTQHFQCGTQYHILILCKIFGGFGSPEL